MKFGDLKSGRVFLYNGHLFYKKDHVEPHGPNVVRCEDGVHYSFQSTIEIEETQDQKWLVEILQIVESFTYGYQSLPIYIRDWWEQRKIDKKEKDSQRLKRKIQDALDKLTEEEERGLLGF